MVWSRHIVTSFPRRSTHTVHENQSFFLNPVPQKAVSDLSKFGYAVVDNFLPERTRCDMLNETRALLTTAHGTANKTQLLRGNKVETVPKAAVLQAELSAMDLEARAAYPTLNALQNDASIAAQASVFWPRLTLTTQAVKAQETNQGGAFPVHVDAAARHDARVVTALLYPHEWPGDELSGALRLYPNPLVPIDIKPSTGRLILLSARSMHHRVLPAKHPRVAVTVWLSGRIRYSEPPRPSASLTKLQRAAFELLTPRFRDIAFKLVLQDEWARSLRESHAPNHAEALVSNLANDVNTICAKLPAALCAALGDGAPEFGVLQRVVTCPAELRQVFEEVEGACNGLPFIW